MNREQIEVDLRSNRSTARLLKKLMCGMASLAVSGAGCAAGCETPACGLAVVGTGVGGVLLLLGLLAYESREYRRLVNLFNESLGGNAEEFVRRNPLAEIREPAEGYFVIYNPDGSALTAIRQGSAAERETERMEQERAGAGRREAPVREEEELGVPSAGTGLGPRPPRATMRTLVDDIVRANYPPINPAYEAAARGGYPRVGAVDDERKEEEDGAPAEGNFLERQRRRNPFYMGMRGLPRED